VPGANDLDAVLRGQARSAAIVGNKEAPQQLAPDNDRDCLCLTEVLRRPIPRTGELIAKHSNVLKFSLIREKRLAENIPRPIQRS